MKIILQKDVKDVGKVGDVVNVSSGFARNFLFPRKLAAEASEAKVTEWEHLKRVAESKKKKAVKERQELLEKISGVSVKFKMAAGETEKLFGTVTTHEISKEFFKLGFSIDRKDIHLDEPIKMLGTHKAIVRMGEGLETSVQIVVEKN